MARHLPWKTETAGSSRKSSPRPTPKRESPGTPAIPRSPSLPRAPLSKSRERVAESDPVRSPSTSPPPEPPQETFMIPGPDQDDRYRMVEDEFLHTAQLFTTHLHRREYHRLRALARTQSAAAIREIERPVVGITTSTARRRKEAVKRGAKQRKVLQDGDAPWMGTSLQGLMESPRKQAKPLASYVAAAAGTRAAAGFAAGLSDRRRVGSGASRREARSPTRSVESETADDLDGSPVPRRALATTHVTQAAVSARSRTRPLKPSSASGSPPRSFPVAAKTPSYSSLKEQGGARSSSRLDEHVDADDDDDDPFGMNRRRIRHQKSREQLRKPQESQPPKKAAPDTMPSFL